MEGAEEPANDEAIASSSPRLEALILGFGDLSGSMGMRFRHEVDNDFRYPGDMWSAHRARMIAACCAAGSDAIDGPFGDFRNPAWSFEFRHPVRELRSEFRCVALDHIGFGLSSRSARREDHRPQSHAHRLAALLDHLDLRDITLFMNDWGGRSASTSRAGTRSASRVSSSRSPACPPVDFGCGAIAVL